MFVVAKFLKTANQVFPLTLWFSLQIARLMHISHSSSYHIVAGKQEHEHYINTHVLEQEQKPHFKFLTLILLCVWVLIGVTLLMISCF